VGEEEEEERRRRRRECTERRRRRRRRRRKRSRRAWGQAMVQAHPQMAQHPVTPLLRSREDRPRAAPGTGPGAGQAGPWSVGRAVEEEQAVVRQLGLLAPLAALCFESCGALLAYPAPAVALDALGGSQVRSRRPRVQDQKSGLSRNDEGMKTPHPVN